MERQIDDLMLQIEGGLCFLEDQDQQIEINNLKNLNKEVQGFLRDAVITGGRYGVVKDYSENLDQQQKEQLTIKKKKKTRKIINTRNSTKNKKNNNQLQLSDLFFQTEEEMLKQDQKDKLQQQLEEEAQRKVKEKENQERQPLQQKTQKIKQKKNLIQKHQQKDSNKETKDIQTFEKKSTTQIKKNLMTLVFSRLQIYQILDFLTIADLMILREVSKEWNFLILKYLGKEKKQVIQQQISAINYLHLIESQNDRNIYFLLREIKNYEENQKQYLNCFSICLLTNNQNNLNKQELEIINNLVNFFENIENCKEFSQHENQQIQSLGRFILNWDKYLNLFENYPILFIDESNRLNFEQLFLSIAIKDEFINSREMLAIKKWIEFIKLIKELIKQNHETFLKIFGQKMQQKFLMKQLLAINYLLKQGVYNYRKAF